MSSSLHNRNGLFGEHFVASDKRARGGLKIGRADHDTNDQCWHSIGEPRAARTVPFDLFSELAMSTLGLALRAQNVNPTRLVPLLNASMRKLLELTFLLKGGSFKVQAALGFNTDKYWQPC